MAYLDPDIAAFQAAGEMNLGKQQLEQQRLAQLSQEAQYYDQQRRIEEQQKLAQREKEKAEYAKWEREQILNQVASELYADKKAVGEFAGIKDSKGRNVYVETPLSAAEQFLAAAKEAARRGKGAYAQEFLVQGQELTAKEQQAKLDAEETRLKNEKLKEEAIELRRKNEGKSRDGAPSLTEVIDPLNPKQMLKIDAETYREDLYKSGDTSGVLGVSGKEPSFAKKEEKEGEGKAALSDAITTLRSYYDSLEERGAIVSSERGALSNIGSTIAASSLGQTVGGALGTESQTIRESINMQRPLLLQAIKQATGMTAKQMDSNAELKLWLNAATDPKASIQANRAALDSISRKYLKEDAEMEQPSTASQPALPTVGTVRNGYVYKGGNPADKNSWEKQ